MERNEFLKLLGTAGLGACSACVFQSCSEDSVVPDPPTNVDFTLDLTAAENASLGVDGGSKYKDGIVIVRLSDTSYIAVSQHCTHQGTTVNFQSSAGNFHCSNHGSRFSTTGTALNGPATKALTRYNTELDGTDLRIFS